MGFSENIKLLRKKRGLTQKQLADNCGLSIATIQGYEQGKYAPKPEAILKLVKALNTTPSELMGYNLEFIKPKNDLVATLSNATVIQTSNKTFENLAISFSKLNHEGQQKAEEYTKDLTKIPEYRKDPDGE